MPRPSNNYWQDGTGPTLSPGLQERENLVKDYIEERTTTMQINPQAGSYTLILGDAGRVVRITSASAHNLTVPANATVAFPIGTIIEIRQAGAGQTTIVPATGVTINSEGGMRRIATQFRSVTLLKVASDTWDLDGSLVA